MQVGQGSSGAGTVRCFRRAGLEHCQLAPTGLASRPLTSRPLPLLLLLQASLDAEDIRNEKVKVLKSMEQVRAPFWG